MKSSKFFRWAVMLTMGALVLEFVLGMYTALFVQFPDSLADGNAWMWSMTNSQVVMAHVIVGTLLVVFGLVALGLGIASKRMSLIVSSALGAVLVFVAWASGGMFLGNVAQDNLSFTMALAFMGSLFAYFMAFYFTRPPLKQ